MNHDQALDYLDSVPLIEALWWYIENANDEWGNGVFFYLRERYRSEYQS